MSLIEIQNSFNQHAFCPYAVFVKMLVLFSLKVNLRHWLKVPGSMKFQMISEHTGCFFSSLVPPLKVQSTKKVDLGEVRCI